MGRKRIEAATIILALLFGMTLPITPVQILWINLITAITLGIALAFEPTEDNTMRRPAQWPDRQLFWRRKNARRIRPTGIRQSRSKDAGCGMRINRASRAAQEFPVYRRQGRRSSVQREKRHGEPAPARHCAEYFRQHRQCERGTSRHH